MAFAKVPLPCIVHEIPLLRQTRQPKVSTPAVSFSETGNKKYAATADNADVHPEIPGKSAMAKAAKASEVTDIKAMHMPT